MAIKNIIRLQNDIVMVFDEGGEQIPEYQSKYDEVRRIILRDAPPEAVFAHVFNGTGKLRRVAREEW